MKPNFSSKKMSRQSQLFSTVAASALMVGLGAGLAHATPPSNLSISVTGAGNTTVGNFYSGQDVGGNSASVTATVSAATLTNSISKSDSQAGSGIPNSQSLANNVINASAVGNIKQINATNALTGLGNEGTSNGSAALVVGSNTGTAGTPVAVIAQASSNTLTTSETNPASGVGNALGQSGNTITANATLNNGLIAVGGAVPTTYVGDGVAGSTTLAPGATGTSSVVSSAGNILNTTNQTNTFAGQESGSAATAENNNSDLNVLNTTGSGSTVADSLNNSSNLIEAAYEGNTAVATIPVGGAGGAPTLDGSASISNLQQNLSDAPTTDATHPMAANVSANNILTQVGMAAGSVSAIGMSGGALTNNNNSITATATDNTTQLPNSSTASAGDVLSLVNGQSLSGSTGTTVNTASVGGAAGSTATADLAVISFQNNSNAPLSSEAVENNIGAAVDSATGTAVDVSGNKVASYVAGNSALNAIEAPGGTGVSTTASFSGTAAVNNVQSSTASAITANTVSNSITSVLGSDFSSKDAAQLTSSNVAQTMTGDGFTASAVTNSANNQLNVAADVVSAGALGAASSAALSSTNSSSSAAAGLSLNNLQYADGTSGGSASISNSYIAVLDENGQGAANGGSISGGSIGITGASDQAIGGSNVANNSLTVNATSLTGSTGIVDTQNNAGGDSATFTNQSGAQTLIGEASDIAVVLAPGTAANPGTTGKVSNEVVTIGGTGAAANTLEATSYNNQGTDTLTVTGVNAAALTNGSRPMMEMLDSSDITPLPVTSVTIGADAVQSPVINATYGSLADQNSSGASSAWFNSSTGAGDATAIPVLLSDQAASTTGSELSVVNNTIEALAFGNQEGSGGQGGNSVTVSPTSLTALGTSTTPAAVAAALTAQTDTGNVTGTITGASGLTDNVQGSLLPSALFVVSVGNASSTVPVVLTSSTVQSNNNASIVQAEGNSDTTTLTAASNNITATGQAGTYVNGAYAAYAAQTAQSSSGNISASQTGVGALVNVDGSVQGSTLATNNNTFQSLALGNTSNTSGTIGSATASEVDTTASATNAQIFSGTTLTASTGAPVSQPSAAAGVYVAGGITGGEIDVKNNTAEASAVGNQGATSLTASAVSLNNGQASPAQASATAVLSSNALSATNVTAPYLVASNQLMSGGAVVSNAYGAFGISDFEATPSVSAATLTVSGNEVNALGEGNMANNTLSLSATQSVTGTNSTTAAAGALLNAQTQSDTVTANSGIFGPKGSPATYGMSVQAPVTGTNNTVALTNNVDYATALGNNANNTTTFTGNEIGGSGTAGAAITQTSANDIDTYTAQADLVLGNNQLSNAAVVATVASQIGNNDAASTGLMTGDSINFSSNQTNAQAINNNATNTLTVAGSITTTSSGTTITPATGVSAASLLTNTQQAEAAATATAEQDISLSVNSGAAPNQPTTSAATSQVALNSNTLEAIATNNQATNTLTENASTTSTGAVGSASANYPGSTTLVSATDVLFNGQDSSLGATATGTDKINSTMTYGTTNTPVAINANQLQVEATNNQATNTLSLTSGVNDTATSALYNDQEGLGPVTANASGSYAASAATSGSATTVTNNIVTAEAAVNAATNNLNVSANNTSNIAAGAATATNGGAQADYALVSEQVAGSSSAVNAPADAVTANGTGSFTDTNVSGTGSTVTGLANGSVAIQGNAEQVLAFGNEALGVGTGASGNVLNITGTGLSATGALANSQQNYNAIQATGTITAQATLNGIGSTAVAQNASLSVTGNSLSVQAAGNAATNVLDVTVNAQYTGTPQGASGAVLNNGSTASADFVLENNQNNEGSVTASAPSAQNINVALNSSPDSSSNYNGVTNAAINVSNNNVTVSAYGNSATNTATLTALNGNGASMAVTSNQLNNGAINANATGIQIGVTTVSVGTGNNNVGSSLSVGGNSITARAVGNSGITVIK